MPGAESALSRRALLLAPAFVRSGRPAPPEAVMTGDVVPGSAIVWARAAGPARMRVRWRGRNVEGPVCTEGSDFTGRVELKGLPPGETVEYEVRFANLDDARAESEPVRGRFRTPPRGPGNVRFLWTGDQVGQGWGIDRARGGMRIYDTMLRREPDFFVHSGDVIYADNPLVPEVALPDGTVWRNVTTEAKSKVAEMLDEFRGQYRYNLLDDNLRRFSAAVSQVWQWDDHEAMNNWSPSKSVAGDARYREKDVAEMVRRARRAFLEYAPMRGAAIYRRIPFGPLLDVFVIDMRSYRGPNSWNRQEREGPETAYLGRAQFEWLRQGLRRSKAVWKAVASDMPLGLEVRDGKDAEGRPMWEAVANGNGPALGRELEIARLLRGIRDDGVRNVVWFTADVHYTAAHFYDPKQARFAEFAPFWEFVSGPMHAGAFGPNALDDTFGPKVVFQKAPPQANLGPAAEYQFFGEVEIDGRTRAMTVTLRDASAAVLHQQVLEANA